MMKELSSSKKGYRWIALVFLIMPISIVLVSTTAHQSESGPDASTNAKPFAISPKVRMIRLKDWHPPKATQAFYPVESSDESIGGQSSSKEKQESGQNKTHNFGAFNLSKNRSIEGLQIERSADGVYRVDLQNRFRSVIVARKTEDGTTVVQCIDGPLQLTQPLPSQQGVK
ncbi:hypothetical protein K8I31_16830 [bacterium]|nr:hypothetical protein [bacterium]